MNAAVFLDRDNTIIHNDGDLGDPDLVKLIQGAASAIASLRGLNYKIIIVTNQGGVARGKYTEDDVQKTNQRVADLVKAASGAMIDRFYYCPYHPQGTVPQYTSEHEWRKPAPGMLLQAAKDMGIDLSQSWMIGDQMRDVQAGVAAGVRSILLRADAQELQPVRSDQLKAGRIEMTGDIPHFTARSLIEAVRIIAQQRKPEADIAHEPARRKWDAAAVRAARENRPSPPPEAPEAPEASPPPETSPETSPEISPETSLESTSEASSDASTHTTSASQAGQAHQAVQPASEPTRPMLTSSTRRSARPFHPLGTAAPTTAAGTPGQTNQANQAAAAPQASAVVTTSANASADTSADSDSHDASASGQRVPSSEVTLRQILQELRNQRPTHQDFSYGRTIAIVMQILAGFLLLAGLLLGSQDTDIFLRWIATAMLAQLAAIAMLLLAR